VSGLSRTSAHQVAGLASGSSLTSALQRELDWTQRAAAVATVFSSTWLRAQRPAVLALVLRLRAATAADEPQASQSTGALATAVAPQAYLHVQAQRQAWVAMSPDPYRRQPLHLGASCLAYPRAAQPT
jgi:hypothetical protein